MKLKIKQNILMEHLNYVIKGISNKNLIPILNCIKFELTNEGLSLTSTDNEIMINTFIKKDEIECIDTLGNIVVSGRYIYDIVKKLPNEIIDIEEVMDSKIYISTKNSSFNLNCNLVNDFPKIDLDESKNPIILSQKIFRNIINQTIFATSTQESRPVLTGLNIKINGNILECTATDSYRLASKKLELKQTMDENVNIIIPTRNLNELIKLLSDEEEMINIHIFNNKVIFKCSANLSISGKATVFDEEQSVWSSEDRAYIYQVNSEVDFTDADAEALCEIEINFDLNDLENSIDIDKVKIINKYSIDINLNYKNTIWNTLYENDDFCDND